MPISLVQALEKLDPELLELIASKGVVRRTCDGLGFLLSKRYSLERLAPLDLRPIDFGSIGRVRVITDGIAKWLESIDSPVQEQLVSLDVLGAYWFRERRITIHWLPIGIACAQFGLPIDGVAAVVLFHELAHAWHHLGLDIDGHDWDTESLARSDACVVEGVAQFYTAWLVELLTRRHNHVRQAWNGLESRQSGPYLKHREWDGIPRVREVIRAALLTTRMQAPIGVSDSQFEEAVARAEEEIIRGTARRGDLRM